MTENGSTSSWTSTAFKDQYEDGTVTDVYEMFTATQQQRSSQYLKWFTNLLNTNNCRNVLDAACGMGVDSIMLLEEGFNVMSTDASDKMLKYALRHRWNRRKEPQFDNWVIEEANWFTLKEDLAEVKGKPSGGCDAVICLGNSFSHILNADRMTLQKKILVNLMSMLKPGGILFIDHRNFDDILATGLVPVKNAFVNNGKIKHVKCSILNVDGKPESVTFDYQLDVQAMKVSGKLKLDIKDEEYVCKLTYYPYQLAEFHDLLRETFGSTVQHETYGDYKPLGEVKTPAWYVHVVRKAK
jgi:glycine N-methyltransferase